MQPKAQVQVDPKRLPIHEWMAVVVIISVFLFLTLLSIANYESPLMETDAVALGEPLIDITIEGAVKFPGTYQFEKGTNLEEALNHAELLPTANVKTLKLDSLLTKKRKITVKETKSKSSARVSQKGISKNK